MTCEADDLGTFVDDELPDDVPVSDESVTAEVIVLYPDPGSATDLVEEPKVVSEPDELDELKAENDRLTVALSKTIERVDELRAKIVGMEYGAGIAERHISFLERERDAAFAEVTRLTDELAARVDELDTARAREHVALQELDIARADNLATVELLELEHQQAIGNERRLHANKLAAAEQRRAAEVAAVERAAAQQLTEAADDRAVAEAALAAEHARALGELEEAHAAELQLADARGAQSMAALYLLMASAWRSAGTSD